jgi:CSLREA domain-containing protein
MGSTWMRGGLRVGLPLLLVLSLSASRDIAHQVPSAQAAGLTFNVDTTVDLVDNNPGDGVCHTAAGNCSLRAAIMEANAQGLLGNPGPHTITLQPGTTYLLSITGPDEDNAGTGDLDIRVSLTITTPPGSTGQATIKPGNLGGFAWNDRIFDIESGLTVTLSGLYLTGGDPNPNGSPEDGGAIYDRSALTLQNTTLYDNAGTFGGGVFNLSTAPVTVVNSTISSNTAFYSGGGIWAGGPLTVTNSTIQDNACLGCDSSPGGGGILSRGPLTMRGSTVSGNSSSSFAGGLRVESFPSAGDINNSTISGNRSALGGGGIVADGGGLSVQGSTISGNQSNGGASNSQGGGIFMFSGSADIKNSTISGNKASTGGGGIFAGATMQLNNVTIAGNSAGSAGGIDSAGGTVTIANTIIATNTATANLPDCHGTLSSLGHNLIGSTSGCTVSGTTTGNILNQQPRLGALADNGGPTQTQALLQRTTSCPVKGPCALYNPSLGIDAGDPDPAGSLSVACLATDQRGVARPLDGNGDGKATCDMGAYEAPALPTLGSFTLTPKDPTTQVGQHLQYSFAWTVPSGGWRSLDSLYLVLRDDQGTALWLRFHEVAGNGSTLSLIDPKNLKEGPGSTFGSPNRLETDAATVYLATSSLDGPAGSNTVTLKLDLGFKPQAAGRTFDVQVLAATDAGDFEGFVDAGSLTVQLGQ